jgi:hypothetical protein
VTDEMERMQKKVTLAYFKTLSHFPGDSEVNHEISVRLTVLWARKENKFLIFMELCMKITSRHVI